MSLLIKICGMKSPENIRQIASLYPDMLGFIFYPKSPRYADNQKELSKLMLPSSVKKIGVFVDATKETIMQKVNIYKLNGVQLHGNESPGLCLALKQQNLKVIKVFSIATVDDFKRCALYANFTDYFLFDTKAELLGGTGQKFDWKIIDSYKGLTPFILSGGIAADDVKALLELKHARFAGIDLNSRFETSPGIKDKELLNTFLQKIREQ